MCRKWRIVSERKAVSEELAAFLVCRGYPLEHVFWTNPRLGIRKLPTPSCRSEVHQIRDALAHDFLDGLHLAIWLSRKLWPLMNAELSQVVSINLCNTNRVKTQSTEIPDEDVCYVILLINDYPIVA